MTASSSSWFSPRRDPLGALRMHEPLGAPGALATMHLGWLVRGGRLVAVKRLHPLHGADEIGRARVREEARRAMSVDHPNVVVTLGIVHRAGETLAAMDYVPGASLAEIGLAARGGLDARVATAIAAGALRGREAAHDSRAPARGVPRAVSPARVLVGEDGRTRVLDFDVPGASTAGAVVDELPYAPPEQLVRGRVRAASAGDGLDPRRDVYTASVVLWETLTGRPLFRRPTVEGMLRAILEGPVPAPSGFAPGIGRALDAIVLRGLARDPGVRFTSAHSMAYALEQASCASAEEVARAVAGMDLPCIRRRRSLAEAVRTREGKALHFECTRSASKE
jgi:serine/threonine-protein kinase